MKKHNGETQEIKEIFNDSNFYRVPDYQRPFYWDESNFEDLVQDLLDAIDNNPSEEYFLGTLVFHHQDSQRIYDIVDGQQRITTLIILIACLRDLIDDETYKDDLQGIIMQKENKVKGIPKKIRIEVRENNFFEKFIVTKDGTLNPTTTEKLTEPEKRYLIAIHTFWEYLTARSQEDLKKLSEYVSQKAILITLYANTFQDAFRLFTIVNDRGRQLRRIDVLKAKNLAELEEKQRSETASTWEDWETELGEKIFENVLYLIRFIYLEEKPYKDLLVEFETKIFKGKEKKIKVGKDFFDVVFKYAQFYDEILEDETYFKEYANKNRVISLLYVMNSQFESYEWKACLLKYIERFGSADIEKFLNNVELKYLEGWVTGLNKDSRTRIWGKIMNTINTAKNSNEINNSENFKVEAQNVKDKLHEDIYGKSYCKYILLRLELLAAEQDALLKFNAKSIEHILPQEMKPESEWAKAFSKADYDKWLNKLPNLILLSKSKNSKARNFDFASKKTKYFENKVSDYPRSKQISIYADWTPAILEKRQEEIDDLCLKSVFEE